MERKISRRTFLKTGTAAALGMAVAPNNIIADEKGSPDAGMSQKKELRFHSNGEFKILQLTDMHYIAGNPESQMSKKCYEEMVDAEKPDLVIITGDLIFGKPGDKSMREVMKYVSGKGVPFAVTFGNHDHQFGFTNEQLYDIISSTKNNIQPDRGGRPSPDYALTIKSSDGTKTAAVVYCIDTHDGADPKSGGSVEGENGYAWITSEQISWYKSQSNMFKKENGGHAVPSIAFFHIPIPEYHSALEDSNFIGTRREYGGHPKLNSGFFTAMREQGDIMATFCGHDHDDDYSVYYHDILLSYGRYSGCNTVYNHLRNGARVILLKEGERIFESWIHIRGGEIKDRITFPDSFLNKDNVNGIQ
jgi:3',5'-cyclic AMP phosphodiesterase CpdA